MADRIGVLTAQIDPVTMRGVEIGGLNHPTFTRAEADIRFLDHLPTDELRAKYAQDPTAVDVVDNMVDVDFVWSPGLRLRDAVGSWAPVDFVIASHVIEHVANPVDWLEQIGEILRDGGILALAIPDKRFCFDAKRPASTLGQIVDAELRDLDVTTYQQIFDFSANYLIDADTPALWRGQDPAEIRRTDIDDPAAYAYGICLDQRATGHYVDVHANTFTPRSLVDILDGLGHIGRLGFEVAAFEPTERPSLEFFVTLRRLPAGLAATERRRRQDAGIELCRARLRSADSIDTAHPGELGLMLSDRERMLILRKRALMRRARQGLSVARRRFRVS